MVPCIAAAIFLALSFVIADASWNVKRSAGGKSANECHLESDPVTMSDGYQDIEGFIRLDHDEIRLVTGSPLDASFTDIGIAVDDNAFVKVEAVRDRKEALFKTAYEQLLQQFIAGSRVVASLRFWPTWPATGIQTASFSLVGFSKAHAEMTACAQ